jgi:cytoskeletal protein RodZ
MTTQMRTVSWICGLLLFAASWVAMSEPIYASAWIEHEGSVTGADARVATYTQGRRSVLITQKGAFWADVALYLVAPPPTAPPPTSTPMPPTATPLPPTPSPTNTDTPIPPTETPTDTAVPPTATPSDTPTQPADTATITAQPTDTAQATVTMTATETPQPSKTPTALPSPTGTSTAEPSPLPLATEPLPTPTTEAPDLAAAVTPSGWVLLIFVSIVLILIAVSLLQRPEAPA